jgi:hypothetical protein
MPTVPKGLGDHNQQQLRFPFAGASCLHDGATVLNWHVWFRSGGKHLGEYCVPCGAWLRWVPQKGVHHDDVD